MVIYFVDHIHLGYDRDRLKTTRGPEWQRHSKRGLTTHLFFDETDVGFDFSQRLFALFLEHGPVLDAVVALVANVFRADRVRRDLQTPRTRALTSGILTCGARGDGGASPLSEDSSSHLWPDPDRRPWISETTIASAASKTCRTTVRRSRRPSRGGCRSWHTRSEVHWKKLKKGPPRSSCSYRHGNSPCNVREPLLSPTARRKIRSSYRRKRPISERLADTIFPVRFACARLAALAGGYRLSRYFPYRFFFFFHDN